MKAKQYDIQVEPDDNGTFLVTVPAFPEIKTRADSFDEAPIVAALAIEEAIAARIHRGDKVPRPLHS
jgi:antitoxin HicB